MYRTQEGERVEWCMVRMPVLEGRRIDCKCTPPQQAIHGAAGLVRREEGHTEWSGPAKCMFCFIYGLF